MGERPDFEIIEKMVRDQSTVLDLGCGDGALLYHLVEKKRVRCQGVEIDEHAIYECVRRGLSVYHGDMDESLIGYQDRSFDYVILNQSMQQLKRPDRVIDESLRVGKQVIIGFPNFAHYGARVQIGLLGRTPVTSSLPYQWYDTPNLHFLSISDFVHYCQERQITIKEARYLAGNREVRFFPNLLANIGIFLIHQTG